MNNVFLAGETIDHCVPKEEDFAECATWFNDQSIKQFLEQGKYPNTILDKREFYESAIKTGRYLTLIKSKDLELLGVFSLSDIDFEKKDVRSLMYTLKEPVKHCLLP